MADLVPVKQAVARASQTCRRYIVHTCSTSALPLPRSHLGARKRQYSAVHQCTTLQCSTLQCSAAQYPAFSRAKSPLVFLAVPPLCVMAPAARSVHLKCSRNAVSLRLHNFLSAQIFCRFFCPGGEWGGVRTEGLGSTGGC